ncbi:MAG: hypothetical protein ACLFTI_01180 [Anaerolineales bacterium]
MSEDFPDWLRDLAPGDAEEDDTPSPESLSLGASSPVMPAVEEDESAVENDDWDMLGDLRGEMEVEETASEETVARRQSSRRIAGLLPWQRFVLALLAFFDIAFVGFLFLVMLGRIAIL